ncbi:hypothetical protein [Pedobacter sp.]
MKKLTSTLGVFALAIGAAAAMAMAPAPKKAEVKTASDPHWFQIGSGGYLGQDSEANKQIECGTPETMDCTVGYEEYDFQNNVPLSDPIPLRGNKQL